MLITTMNVMKAFNEAHKEVYGLDAISNPHTSVYVMPRNRYYIEFKSLTDEGVRPTILYRTILAPNEHHGLTSLRDLILDLILITDGADRQFIEDAYKRIQKDRDAQREVEARERALFPNQVVTDHLTVYGAEIIQTRHLGKIDQHNVYTRVRGVLKLQREKVSERVAESYVADTHDFFKEVMPSMIDAETSTSAE